MIRLFTISTFLFAFSYCVAQTPYYILKGNIITRIENSNPSDIKAREWQVRLYKKQASKTGNSYWGTIKGSSAKEVMAKLKSHQDFELSFNYFIGKGQVQNDVFTNFNAQGPIAIIDEFTNDQPSQNDSYEKLTELISLAENNFHLYSEVKENLNIILKGKPSTSFDNVGSVFKEYTENLRDAFLQINSLRKLLEGTLSSSMDKINNDIKEINAKLQLANNKRNDILTRIDVNRINNSDTEPKKVHTNTIFIFLSVSISVDGKSTTIMSTPIQYNGNLNDEMNPYKKDFIEKINAQLFDKPNILKQNFQRDNYENIIIHYSKPYSTIVLKSEIECLNAIAEFKQFLEDTVEGLPNAEIDFYQLK